MRAHIEEISTKGTPCYSVPLKILRTIIVEVHMDIHSFLALEIIVQLKCLTYQNCSLYWPSLLHTLFLHQLCLCYRYYFVENNFCK